MSESKLKVRMLGELSVSYEDVQVRDSDSRSYKVWLLLAYLIYNKNRPSRLDELMQLLCSDGKSSNPSGVLKTAIWRARRLLEPLSDKVGEDLIVCKSGTYGWNQNIEMTIDLEEFERLCYDGGQETDPHARLEKYRKALEMFESGPLTRFASEVWVSPIVAYYQDLFNDTLLEALPLFDLQEDAKEAEALCQRALASNPFDESLHCFLMRSLIAQDDYEGAQEAYENLRSLLLSELDIMPGEDAQAVYQEIMQHLDGRTYLSPDSIREQLREKEPTGGAMLCDYATFKLFYQAEARSAARRGDAVHLGLLSVVSKTNRDLSKRVVKTAVEQLRETVQDGLRKGDVAAQCSETQYLLMLLQANYENSEMVCRRLTTAFDIAHPRSQARIRVDVLPLEPTFKL